MSDISSKQIFGAFAEKGKEFTFEIKPKNLIEKILQKANIIAKTKTLNVKPIRLGVRSICATYINHVSFDKYSNNTVFKAGTLLAQHETENIVMFLAYILWNKESTPPNWLIRCIRSMDQQSVDELILFAFESMGTQGFLNSIISMTGVSLQPEEIIAPEK